MAETKRTPLVPPGATASEAAAAMPAPELTFAERLAIVSVVMQYGSERDREKPIAGAIEIAEGLVGPGWPLADGTPRTST